MAPDYRVFAGYKTGTPNQRRNFANPMNILGSVFL
jgi:hypothetical protein